MKGSKKGSEIKVKLLTFTDQIQARFASFNKFRTGKLEFLFSNPMPN